MQKLNDEELLKAIKLRFDNYKTSLDELQVLTKELQNANMRLEESESMKSHFISNITNEIINPFTSIMALAKSILKVKKEDWKKVISMVALIHSEAFNLDFQFRNIFVAAKLEGGDVLPEVLRVDIKHLIHNLIDDFKIEAKKKRLHIETEFLLPEHETEEYYFKTDPEKLKLILSNLLFNAIKYSYADERIDLKVELENDVLEISVKDYGTGISKENQQVIFDRFKRLDSGINSINRGHGLGLSINKALLDLMDGQIGVNSELGEGAEFVISVPESQKEVEGFATDDSELFFSDDEEIF